jgi:thiamine-monophosphate kinase
LTTDRVPLSAYKRSSSYVGKLCVTHNFSDIICKGGLPIGLLLGTYVPRETSVEDWKTIIIAARDWAAKFNAYILGGDTKESPTLCIVGCAVGFVEKSKLLRRDTANSGDILAVTLANARKIGLPWTYILSNSLHWNLPGPDYDFLEARFMDQNLSLPFQETIAANRSTGITSSADTSDGLGGAIHILSTSSGLGVNLQYDSIRACIDQHVGRYASRLGVDIMNFAFTPGYVWENLFTVSPESFRAVQSRVRAVGGDLLDLGVMTADHSDIKLTTPEGKTVPFSLFFNEGFRSDREISNSTEAWLQHRFY